MSTVNFLEIPKANTGDGNQDTFELFARDLLESMGFKIIQGPGRGADSGRDLIIEERRVGVGGETSIRWIVSCKHYAHSGNSVGTDHEINITDRIKTGKASGFMAFYSSLPSASLITKLQELGPDLESTVFDRAKIEAAILKNDSGHRLFSRYFPNSYKNWSVANPSKPKLYFEGEILSCEFCGRDLLDKHRIQLSMVVMWENRSTSQIDSVYWCCKGHCDNALRGRYSMATHTDLWDELSGYAIPTLYILTVSSYIASLNKNTRFASDALSKFRKLLLLTFHHVSRTLTPSEEAIVKTHIEFGII